MINKKWILVLGIAVLGLSACDKDDDLKDKIIPPGGKGDFLISTMISNPGGKTGSAYLQLIDKIEDMTLENTNALPTTYSCPPIAIGNEVYILTGTTLETDIVKKYVHKNHVLNKEGEITLPEKAGSIDIEVVGNKAYISCQYRGSVYVIDRTTMTKIKEIDLSKYGKGDNNPDPGLLIARGDKVYVTLQQLKGGTGYPAAESPRIDVAIIDTNTDDVLKVISEETSGFSFPLGLHDKTLLFMDENENIYITCVGGMLRFKGHKSGFLRIKKGETEFDPNYRFEVSKIEGEKNQANAMLNVLYDKNNILYAIMHVPAYYLTGDYFKDRVGLPCKIDLEKQTITSLGMPRSSFFGKTMELYNDNIVYGLDTDNDMGFYLYNKNTGTASQSAVIKTTGYPYMFYQFN